MVMMTIETFYSNFICFQLKQKAAREAISKANEDIGTAKADLIEVRKQIYSFCSQTIVKIFAYFADRLRDKRS